MNHAEHKRSTFSGKIGFVLSAAGASVGLGNIWRFPYLAAKYGGGIFLLVYIILAMTFGYTMIVAETSLGRSRRGSGCARSRGHAYGYARAYGSHRRHGYARGCGQFRRDRGQDAWFCLLDDFLLYYIVSS